MIDARHRAKQDQSINYNAYCDLTSLNHFKYLEINVQILLKPVSEIRFIVIAYML